jgi:hypothetical protein
MEPRCQSGHQTGSEGISPRFQSGHMKAKWGQMGCPPGVRIRTGARELGWTQIPGPDMLDGVGGLMLCPVAQL